MKATPSTTDRGFYAAAIEEIKQGWEATLPDVDASALPLFARMAVLAKLYSDFFDRLLRPFAITRAEYETLGILRAGAGAKHCSPTELAALAGQSTAGMTKTLDRLERAGLAERRAHPSDRRRIEVAISGKGASLAERIFRAHIQELDALLENLNENKRNRIDRGLEELIECFLRLRR